VTNLSNLSQYMAVIFFSNSRDALWDHGRAVNPTFAVSTTTSAYLDQSKVLLRSTSVPAAASSPCTTRTGTEYNWPWYEGLLGNSNYYDHGQFQPGQMVVTSSDSSTDPLGPPGTRVNFADEWYNLVPFPTNVKFLATVDEDTLATKRSTHPGFPSFHPVAWCQYYDGGRAWITTLGHDARATADLSLPENQPGGTGYFAGSDAFQKLLVNGIKSAMGLQPFCTTYAFSGFSGTTLNPPSANTAKAGSNVNVSFGLGANHGSSPFTVSSAPMSCTTGLMTGNPDPREAPTGASVDGSGQYTFSWKTDKSWAGSCRQLLVALNDGTIRTAHFQFN
jgi:hypothetical protein